MQSNLKQRKGVRFQLDDQVILVNHRQDKTSSFVNTEIKFQPKQGTIHILRHYFRRLGHTEQIWLDLIFQIFANFLGQITLPS